MVERPPSRAEMLQPLVDEASRPAAAIFRYNPAWRVPHTAFSDHSLPGARPRESIEFRSVAYFL